VTGDTLNAFFSKIIVKNKKFLEGVFFFRFYSFKMFLKKLLDVILLYPPRLPPHFINLGSVLNGALKSIHHNPISHLRPIEVDFAY
jgi:hypothetical protein